MKSDNSFQKHFSVGHMNSSLVEFPNLTDLNGKISTVSLSHCLIILFKRKDFTPVKLLIWKHAT